MNTRNKRKRSEVLRNRALALLAVAVVALVAVIVIKQPKEENKPVAQPSSESKPEPLPESSSDEPQASEPSQSDTSPSEQPEASSSSLSASSGSAGTSSSTPVSTATQDKYYEADLPMLVNPTNKIPEGYSPELADIGNGYKLQTRAAAAFNDMMQKAVQDGVSLWIVSAYRSHEKQTTNFNNKIREFESQGYTAEKAYAATAKLIAVPGTSEHSLGYAVDLNSLETTFEGTKQFKWLMENCADFGFALRYPKDKVEITDISYEPWHYRYVGSNHAKVIMENGICLEEYLSGDYQ